MELTLQEEVRRLHEQHQQRIKEPDREQQPQSQPLSQPSPLSVGEGQRKEQSPTDDVTDNSTAATAAAAAAPSSSPSPPLSLSLSLSRSVSLPYPLPLPLHWPSTQPHHVSLQSVPRDSADFLMVQNMMQANGGLDPSKTAVLQVQRVFNRPLWERYAAARHRLMHKIGNESLCCAASMGNEQLLFHGTRQNQPHLIYATADGFDVRMAGQGMYGPGLYFSRSAAYSGQSYAHPLQAPSWGYGGHSAPPQSVIPPLFTTCPKSGKLKAEKIPPNSFQMFLARVALGTSYDARKNGAPSGGFHGARPPLRPFNCPQCKKHVDLNQINIEVLKDTLAAGAATAAAVTNSTESANGDGEALGDTVPANAQANRGKRKRGSAKAALAVAPQQVTAASASGLGTAVGTASAVVAAAAAGPVAAFTPRKTRRQTAMAASAAVPSAAVAAAVSGPVAPIAAPAAQTVAPVVALPTFAPLPLPPPTPVNAADVMADGPAAVDLGTTDVAPAAAAAAAAVATPAAAPLSFDSHPVSVSCPSCRVSLGSRASLLAHPYRYDSVTSDHMSITYDSACAYPEFLITYSYNR